MALSPNLRAALRAIDNNDAEAAIECIRSEIAIRNRKRPPTQVTSVRLPSKLLSQLKSNKARNGQSVSAVLTAGAKLLLAANEKNRPQDFRKILEKIAGLLGLDPELVSIESVSEALKAMQGGDGDPLADVADLPSPEQLKKAGLTPETFRMRKAAAIRRR